MTKIDKPSRDLAADAERLRALHVPGTPLLLANAWDPTVAQAVEAAGMPAVATASAVVAPVAGYEDHGHMPPDVAFAAIARIAAAVSCPVTADLEDGYGLPARELVERLLAAGACGLNLEDSDHRGGGLVDAAVQADRIAAIRQAGEDLGVRVVINARVDVHMQQGEAAEGLERARLYRAAGADCIYPIFLADPALVREHVALGPVNLLAHPGGMALAEIAELGVARISVGPLLHRAMIARVRQAAEAMANMNDTGLWQ
ncbi:isocitrate lyase/PEP mutase family protein [Novosphingobium sp. JCM 18896]|uniref:isocitrate lyase/PEP mutase family protein n=1 Tax=Novosphingobium sp. JCM 18896 TaxID=2989731 RepID=UPI002223E452|nr:isocitrate lyase/phosphoenolpyruvate mutase family protein [Novosphingobium sp. JCM 18896]MCW1429893.1 isocitrate lyase/phosphoenolpyruvate mutase family protein [Novosphingobium sp. JCM 18896]